MFLKKGSKIISNYFNLFLKKNKNIKIGIGRAGNVIGGGDWARDRIIPDCFRSWSSNKVVEIRNPFSTRPWQHVLEPLSGYLILGHKLMKKELKSNLMPHWNFGPHKKNCKKVHSIVRLLIKEWGEKKQKIVFKRNKNFSLSASKRALKTIRKFKWEKVLSVLNKTLE